jgi:xylose isomerase
MLAPGAQLADIAGRVEKEAIDPKPRSGKQEFLENLFNRFM